MYARFFSINGRIEWDSIRDDADLNARIIPALDTKERKQFDAERKNLNTPGGFIRLPYALIVRTA